MCGGGNTLAIFLALRLKAPITLLNVINPFMPLGGCSVILQNHILKSLK